VINQGKILPQEVVDLWPEVFEGIKIKSLPLKYLESVSINFKDGKSWEVKLTAKAKKDGWDVFCNSLSELLLSYEDRIDDIDFKLNTVRVKKDIERSTSKFLKKQKL